MANSIQSLLINRTVWFQNQIKCYKFFKYVSSKSFLCGSNRKQFAVQNHDIASSHKKWNICQSCYQQISLPVVFNVGLCSKLDIEKKEQNLAHPNEKLMNTTFMFEKSNELLIDKKRIEEINNIVREKEIKNQEKRENDAQDKPSKEQIDLAAQILAEDLNHFFVRPMNYHIYDRNLIFENHVRGTKSVRLQDYASQIAFVRAIGHLKYAYVEFQVLKMTTHYSEGTIKVRWRIKGLSGFRVFMNFWRYKIWNLKETAFHDVESWYDGFSILYLKGNGRIYKHVLLKMQPDEDKNTATVKPNSPVAAKFS